MDYNSFAEQIKSKYPQYKNVDNFTLAQKMIEKYPVYQSKVSFAKQEKGVAGFSTGLAKGVLSSVRGAGQVGEKVLNTLVPKSMEQNIYSDQNLNNSQGIGKIISPSVTTPQGTAENIGFGVEKIAEFLAPSSKISSVEQKLTGLVKGTKRASRLARTAIRSGSEAVANTGISTIQEGGLNDKVKTSAIVSAIFPALGGITQEAKLVSSRATGKLGQKIQETVIRPRDIDYRDGFKIENVNKYKLGGSLKQTVAKTQTKLNDLTEQLNTKLKKSNASVNLNTVYDDTIRKLSGDKRLTFGDNKAIQKVLGDLKSEITDVAGENGLTDIYGATLVKRGAGTKGAWAYGRVEPDASAVEKVYTAFYGALKDAIEKNAPKEVADINKQISELIPISNASLRRLPVEQRNNVISLTDSIGLYGAMFDPKALALIGANRLSKSGKFGNFLVNISDRLSKSKLPSGKVGSRVFGK